MNRFTTLAAGGLATAAGIATLGASLAFAQEGDDATTTPGVEQQEENETRASAFLDDVAAELGITAEELSEAIKAVQLARIDEAVASGDLDEAAAERRRERIEAGEAGPFFHFGPGPFQGHHAARLSMHISLEQAADFMGLTTEDVRAGFQEGRTLAEMAEEAGIARDDLVAHLVESVNTRIDEALAEGNISDDRAAVLRERVTGHVETLVDTVHDGKPAFRPHFRGGHRGGPFSGGDWFPEREKSADEEESAFGTGISS